MQILTTSQGDVHELVLVGRVDGEGADQLEVTLLKTVAAGAKNVTVEMSEVTFFCSAALRAILQHWRQLQQKGGTLHVANPSGDAMALLSTSGFRDLLIKRS